MIQEIINARRQNKGAEDNLISMLVENKLFDNDEMIIDEMITFFAAGMKTI